MHFSDVSVCLLYTVHNDNITGVSKTTMFIVNSHYCCCDLDGMKGERDFLK